MVLSNHHLMLEWPERLRLLDTVKCCHKHEKTSQNAEQMSSWFMVLLVLSLMDSG